MRAGSLSGRSNSRARGSGSRPPGASPRDAAGISGSRLHQPEKCLRGTDDPILLGADLTAEFVTLRLRLIKIAARVVEGTAPIPVLAGPFPPPGPLTPDPFP